jgi:hypothetical protein
MFRPQRPFRGPLLNKYTDLEKGEIYYYHNQPWLTLPMYLNSNRYVFLARHDGYFNPPQPANAAAGSQPPTKRLIYTTLDGVQHTEDATEFNIYAYIPPELDQITSRSPLAGQYLEPYLVLGGVEGVRNRITKITKKMARDRRGPLVNFFIKEEKLAAGAGGGSTGGSRKARYRKARYRKAHRRRKTIRK